MGEIKLWASGRVQKLKLKMQIGYHKKLLKMLMFRGRVDDGMGIGEGGRMVYG